MKYGYILFVCFSLSFLVLLFSMIVFFRLSSIELRPLILFFVF